MEVFHIAKLQANLLSMSKLMLSGLKVYFNMDGCIVSALSGEFVVRASHEGNLYQITFSKMHVIDEVNVAQSSSNQEALELWHRQIGHLNVKGVCTL